MNSPLLALDHVRFAYLGGSFSLSIDGLHLERGEHSACIGPSGTGKTTLLHLVAGILVPEQGSIVLDGTAVHELSDPARRAMRLHRIGMVFQRFELLDYLNARDNALLPYHLAGDRAALQQARPRAEALADSMGISHVLDRRPHRLSQGEQQRVAICRAMITEPDLLLCDEPTGNLDPDTSGRVLDLLFEQVERLGATLFVVTHDHDLLGRFERVIDVRELTERQAG